MNKLSLTVASALIAGTSLLPLKVNAPTTIPYYDSLKIAEILKPSPSKVGIVVIDAGHDTLNTGWNQKGNREELLTLELSKKIQTRLEEKNYFTIMTRTSNSPVNIDHKDLNNDRKIDVLDERLARSAFIRETPANCAIIIHFDAYKKSSKVEGIRLHFFGHQYKSQLNDGKKTHTNPEHCRYYSKPSRELTYKLAEYMRSKGEKVSVIASDFTLLQNQTVPAVYCELGFMTNKKNLQRIISEEGQNEIAEMFSEFFGNAENHEYIASLNKNFIEEHNKKLDLMKKERDTLSIEKLVLPYYFLSDYNKNLLTSEINK